MNETVMVKEEPKKVAFMDRKNANSNRIEKDQEELDKLLEERKGEATERQQIEHA